jgi:hypothetical protein
MQKFELLHRAAENGLLVIERDCLVFFFFLDGYYSDCFPLYACILGRNGRLDSLIAKIQGYCHYCRLTILSEFSIKQNLSFNFSSKPLVSES